MVSKWSVWFQRYIRPVYKAVFFLISHTLRHHRFSHSFHSRLRGGKYYRLNWSKLLLKVALTPLLAATVTSTSSATSLPNGRISFWTMNIKSFTIIFVLHLNFCTVFCQQQNHIYASTKELSILQQKFVKFLKEIRNQNFKSLENLKVENPVHGYVFLRSILTDFSNEIYRFKKKLLDDQVKRMPIKSTIFYS